VDLVSDTYAYLGVRVADCDVVTGADGAVQVVARGEGAAAAVAAPAGAPPTTDDATAAVLARQREVHRAWEARLDAALIGGSILANRQIREEFIRNDPEPVVGEGGVEVAELTPAITEARWWLAQAELGDVPLRRWLAPAEESFPRAGIARVLSELAAQGWIFKHVSEERFATYGDREARTQVSGAWFLLGRI
jgi:hypothetical protein